MRPRLFRVIVPVVDVERAQRFYAELLGIDGERVSRGRHYFDCSATILALLDPIADGEGHEFSPNPEHIYLAVGDLDSAYERALQLGAAPGAIADRAWGERSFYLRDPFGNKLCLVAAGTEFRGGRFVE